MLKKLFVLDNTEKFYWYYNHEISWGVYKIMIVLELESIQKSIHLDVKSE